MVLAGVGKSISSRGSRILAQAVAVAALSLGAVAAEAAPGITGTNFGGAITPGSNFELRHRDPSNAVGQWSYWTFRVVLRTGGVDVPVTVGAGAVSEGGGVWGTNSDGQIRSMSASLPAGDGQLRVTGVSHVVSYTQAVGTGATGDPACGDGVDNDGDGLVDMSDPGCTSAGDTDEYNAPPPPAACGDGVDNDGDGKIDGADPGCEGGTADTSETDPPPGMPSSVSFGAAAAGALQQLGGIFGALLVFGVLFVLMTRVSWPWLKRITAVINAAKERQKRDLAGKIHARDLMIKSYGKMHRAEQDSVKREQLADRLTQLRKERTQAWREYYGKA